MTEKVTVTFRNEDQQKEIKVLITPDGEQHMNVSIDFGEEGSEGHNGDHVGFMDLFCKLLIPQDETN